MGKGRAQVIEAEGHGSERISQISCIAIFVLLLFVDGYSKGGHPINSPEEVFCYGEALSLFVGFVVPRVDPCPIPGRLQG
jgi:hypothetical protein